MTQVEQDHSLVSATGQEHTSVQASLKRLASAMHDSQTSESIDNLREMNAILWRQNDLLKRQLGKSRRAAYWQFAIFFAVLGIMAWQLGAGL